jgi:hypothetical protein
MLCFNKKCLPTNRSLETFRFTQVLSPPTSSGVGSQLVSVNLPIAVTTNSAAVATLAADFGVVVKLLPDHEGGTPLVVNAIRISHHLFNDESDVAKLVAGLNAVLNVDATKAN